MGIGTGLHRPLRFRRAPRLATGGPLAFQGLTCGGDCLLMVGSRLARGRDRPDMACRLGGTVKSTFQGLAMRVRFTIAVASALCAIGTVAGAEPSNSIEPRTLILATKARALTTFVHRHCNQYKVNWGEWDKVLSGAGLSEAILDRPDLWRLHNQAVVDLAGANRKEACSNIYLSHGPGSVTPIIELNK